MLNPLFTITALALIIAVVLMEIILARRCSSFKVVIPMIIIAGHHMRTHCICLISEQRV